MPSRMPMLHPRDTGCHPCRGAEPPSSPVTRAPGTAFLVPPCPCPVGEPQFLGRAWRGPPAPGILPIPARSQTPTPGVPVGSRGVSAKGAERRGPSALQEQRGQGRASWASAGAQWHPTAPSSPPRGPQPRWQAGHGEGRGGKLWVAATSPKPLSRGDGQLPRGDADSHHPHPPTGRC